MPRDRPAASWGGLAAAAILGFGTCGLWLGVLTLRLNPELLERGRDAGLLLLYFVVVYALLGLLAGTLCGAFVALLRWLATVRAASTATSLLRPVLALAPLLTVALLPDTGLWTSLLTDALFGGGTRLLVLAIGVLALAGLLGFLIQGLTRWKPFRRRPGLVQATVWFTATLTFLVYAGPRQEPASPSQRPLVEAPAPGGGTPAPGTSAGTSMTGTSMNSAQKVPPVILLCIDGADPDDALLPLINAGELPTFRRLRAEGVWGELETIYPTLSPAIWTTLATGKPPEAHGVRHFVVFDLPGLSRPVRHFPLHTGLNFRLIPWIERLPGVPPLQIPYTSDLRRTRALWSILGDTLPVGVYGWRVTWPAEPVQGFNIATGVTLLDELTRQRGHDGRLMERSVHPDGALTDLRTEGLLPARILSRRRALEELTALADHYRPAFLAAGFYSVDAEQHLASHFPATGPASLPAKIVDAYRLTDTRLGKLHANLQRIYGEVNLIVVSDHGFDFRHHHHTHAPPGLFLAHGPAFRSGVTVDGLTVYDIAPLVLALLNRPLALDMPGTSSDRLQQPLRRSTSPALVATYEEERSTLLGPTQAPLDQETKERLKALGYLN